MGIRSLLMIEQGEPRDLAALVVPLVGSLQRVDDPWEPCRVCDPAGVVIGPVAVYLRDLQAAGRPETTLRAYATALLRWLRFGWAVEVAWDQATRSEARVILSPQRTVFHVQERHLSRCSLPGGHGYLSLHLARR